MLTEGNCKKFVLFSVVCYSADGYEAYRRSISQDCEGKKHTHTLPQDWNMCSVVIALFSVSLAVVPLLKAKSCVCVCLCLKMQVHFRAHLSRLPVPAALIVCFFHAWTSDPVVDNSTQTHTHTLWRYVLCECAVHCRWIHVQTWGIWRCWYYMKINHRLCS